VEKSTLQFQETNFAAYGGYLHLTYLGSCIYTHHFYNLHKTIFVEQAVIKWIPCYQGMVHSQVTDEGDRLQT
jgi:hypothetical protein